jgi:SecD/SecF fusion protein
MIRSSVFAIEAAWAFMSLANSKQVTMGALMRVSTTSRTIPPRYTPFTFFALEALVLRSRSYLFLVLVVALASLSFFLLGRTHTNWGLDVQGGIRIIYQIDPKDLGTRKPAELAPRILSVLERRVSSSLGVVEGNVSQKGVDQFIIELPGYTDQASAEKTLGKAASLKFYHAKTVVTERSQYRLYRDSGGSDDPANPQVWFTRTGGDPTQIIKPGTPEYDQVIASWGDPIIEGDDLANAQPKDLGYSVVPELIFSPAGSNKIETWSRRYVNQGEKIAAVLDGVVLSDPGVKDNTILKESCFIDGRYKNDYVTSFCDILNSGALPVKLDTASTENIDALIGRSALHQMINAGYIAFAVISVFMLLYYGFPGLVAIIALGLYVVFTITTLRLMGATFSLAAIAGFILSVGMAVDANILVFERFKEEIKSGKDLQHAIELGFKRALPAIIDSNACTILTSLVLAVLGTGAVKGFATSLIVGVVISLFTAVTVTRSLLMFFIGSGIASNPKLYALNHNWFKNVEERAKDHPLRVVENSTKFFLASLLTIVIFIPFAFMGGFKPNVEFRGGYEVELMLNNAAKTRDQIEAGLKQAGFEGANVKMVGGGTGAIVSVPPTGTEAGESSSQALAMASKIATAVGVPVTDAKSPSYIGPTIQKEMLYNAVLAVIISSILIVVYLAFRFGFAVGTFVLGLRFGVSAIGALLHDILVVIGITAFCGWLEHWEISSLFITSMLTVIGFSVHDTIVIFDRIRENLRKPQPGETFDHLVDRSITQSFARSINTSMTVVVTLFILLVVGSATPDLKLFCVTMLAGIISGTYSSIFNASPILYLWDKAIGKKKGEDATLVGSARREAANQRIVTPSMADVAPTSSSDSPRSYGQVRRRAGSQPKKMEIEEP